MIVSSTKSAEALQNYKHFVQNLKDLLNLNDLLNQNKKYHENKTVNRLLSEVLEKLKINRNSFDQFDTYFLIYENTTYINARIFM